MLRFTGALLGAALLFAQPAGAVLPGGRMTPVELDGVINHGSGKTVALTFDACPRPKGSFSYDPQIIEILRKEHVPATLFISGTWAQTHPDIVKALAKDPLFEIGNHGHTHRKMVGLPPQTYRHELARSQGVLAKLTGGAPRLWRPPFGDLDAPALHAANAQGLRTVNFSLASGDPDERISTKRLVRGVVENAKPGAIVVMHMNGNGHHTAEALPLIIEGLRKRGFQFVTAGSYANLPRTIANVQTR